MGLESMRVGRQNSVICPPTPQQGLLDAVAKNEVHTIRQLVHDKPNLLSHIYSHPHNKPILYIAIYDFATDVRSETVDVLIELGADLFYHDIEDDNKEAIHFAALGQNPSILKTVIKHIKSPEKLNALANGNTALSLLIKEGDPDSQNFEKCLRVLVNSSLDINKPDKKNETPILIACRKKYKTVIDVILKSGKFVDIDSHQYRKKTARVLIEEHNLYEGDLPDHASDNNNLNKTNTDILVSYIRSWNEEDFIRFPYIQDHVDDSIEDGTLLQLACDGNLKLIVNHLLENNVDVTKVTEKNKRYPIEIAGDHGFWEIFQVLLPKYKKIPNDLLTTLLKSIIHDTTPEMDHKKCLKMLLKEDIDIPVNSIYQNGNTALHYAVKYADSETILNLLQRGASLGNKNSFDILPVEDIDAKTLERHFDNCITTKHEPKFDKQSTVVTFDYKSLIPAEQPQIPNNKLDIESNLIDQKPPKVVPETDVVLAISKNSEIKHLLNHPLISSYLYIKWHQLNWFFYTNLIFYTLFLISLIAYIFSADYNFGNDFSRVLSIGVLVVTFFILFLREFLQIIISPKTYFLHFENILELALICVTGYIIFQPDKDIHTYKQMSALAILLSALEMMLLIGQHPRLSTSIVIFRTVSFNFFKFLLWYAILILAFVLSFYKLFNKNDEETQSNSNSTTTESSDDGNDFFVEPSLTFIKIIVMLTGEFDASSLNFDTFSNKVLFLVFVFLIPIILFNLLNGLAVSDTQAIKNDAEIIGHIERINHIVYIENMMLGNFIPSFLKYILCCCNDSSRIKRWSLPKWLNTICLFPCTYKDYKMQMYLYHEGKIIRDIRGSCKHLKEVYLDKKTVKRVKHILQERNNADVETSKIHELQQEIKILRDTIDRLVSGSR